MILEPKLTKDNVAGSKHEKPLSILVIEKDFLHRTASFPPIREALQVIECDETSPYVIYIERDRDPLFANRMVKEAAENDYVLTSKQIQEILGIKPKGKTRNRHTTFNIMNKTLQKRCQP